MADDSGLTGDSGWSSDSGGSSSSSSSSGGGDSRWKKALRAGGRSLNQSGQSTLESVREQAAANVSRGDSYKRGGRVKRTGLAKVHRGERVIPKSKVKRVEKMMRSKKMRMKSGRG